MIWSAGRAVNCSDQIDWDARMLEISTELVPQARMQVSRLIEHVIWWLPDLRGVRFG